MVTIKEVAERAGVSISTVSNVLNQKKYVSNELQERVYSAVKELNYVQDSVASSMKRGYTMTIGIITSDICGLFYPYVLKGIYEVLGEQGYDFTILDSHVRPGKKSAGDREMDCFMRLFSNHVDGVIFASNVLNENEKNFISRLKKEANRFKRTPLVSLERDFSHYGIDSVYYNNAEVARLATQHLVDCGCKNILHIAGTDDEEIPRKRKETFFEVIRRNSLPCSYNPGVIYGDYTHGSSYEGLKRYVETYGINFDGIYAANDQMAIGALKYLNELNIEVPGQVKVIGNDNVFVSEMMTPSLSSVSLKKTTIGRSAGSIMLTRLNQEKDGNAEYTGVLTKETSVDLIVRESTSEGAEGRDTSGEW